MSSRTQLLKRRIPFRYRLLIAFSIPLIIWLIVSAINIISLNESVRRGEQLYESQETILLANEYLNAVLGALAAKRGYIITSDPEFLNPFRRATNQVNRLHIRIAELTRNDQEQQQRIEEASELVQRWLHDIAREQISARQQLSASTLQRAYALQRKLLALRNAHLLIDEEGMPERGLLSSIRDDIRSIMSSRTSLEYREILDNASAELFRYVAAMDMEERTEMNDALDNMNSLLTQTVQEIIDTDRTIRMIVGSDEGDVLLSEFHRIMMEFIEIETMELEVNREKVVAAGDRSKLLIRAGPAIGLLFMILVTSWIAQRINRSLTSVSNAASELSKGNMSARAEVRGNDEFGLLAERFNTMAELLGNRSRESTALAELGELLQSCSSIKEATSIFAQLAGNILPDHPGVLYLLSPSRDDVTSVVSWNGGDEYSEDAFLPDACWALRLGKIHHSAQGNTMFCEHMIRHEHDSICLPLHAFGDTIGMLLVLVPREIQERALREQHNAFLETVAEQLALSLANLRMREKLRNQSIRDPLTGLYNRRYLDESFRRELHRASRHEMPLSILSFDIDHFKRFNDTHGHDGGDAVLRTVGHCLEDFFRSEDGAFRLGGEEFIAILADTTLEDALSRAEELRERVARLQVQHENIVLPPVTISIGVATFPIHGQTLEELLKAADRALYDAKERGRNRVSAAR